MDVTRLTLDPRFLFSVDRQKSPDPAQEAVSMHSLRPAVRVVATLAATALVLSACGGAGGDGGGGSGGGGAGDTTLRMAISSDPSTLDPSTVYQYEGNQILTAAYEGLLSYATDSSSDIVPALAESYEVSDDGLTYTFKLHEGVTFASGETMTSADVQQSFERLADPAVESQMSYMVMGIEGYETPDDATFVVTLSAPSSSFLSLVASPFGPKVIDGSVLDEHAADSALGYLAEHTAGTGAYQLSSMTKGDRYVLTRSDDYWGDEPFFEEVDVKVVPDAGTQLLQLQGGDLDIVSGQPIQTVDSLGDEFTVLDLPLLQKEQLHLKVTGALADAELRTALRAAIDRDTLVTQGYGDHAAVSTQMYPIEMVPEGTAPDGWEADPSGLAAVAGDTQLTLGYLSGQAQDKQLAGTLQAQWQAAGADVQLVPIQSGDIYGFSANLDAAPDMILESSYPDSTHPDTWARLFWYSDTASGNGFLNYLVGGTPEADALIDTGAGEIDEAAADASYAAASDLVHEQASYITLADLKDTFVLGSDIEGDGHWLPCPRTLDLRSLSRSGS
jgi:peptide/nickel transport system substrate-binding protein